MKLRVGSVALMIAALSVSGSPANAHGGAEGSALSPLSIGLGIGGFLFLVCAALASTRGFRRTGVAVFAIGIAMIGLAGADIVADSRKGEESPPEGLVVEVLEPENGAVVSSPVKFRVRVEGGTLVPLTQTEGDNDQGHLHIAIDGRTVDMPVTSEFTVEIPPGIHVIQVEFTAANHMSFEPPVQRTLQITVASPGDSPSPSVPGTAGPPSA